MMKKAGVSVVLLVLVLLLPGSAGAGRADGAKIDPALQAALDAAAPDAQVTAIVTLVQQTDLAPAPRLKPQRPAVGSRRTTAPGRRAKPGAAARVAHPAPSRRFSVDGRAILAAERALGDG